MIAFQVDELTLSAIGSWPLPIRGVLLLGGFLGLLYLGYNLDVEQLEMQYQAVHLKKQNKEAQFKHYQTQLENLLEIREEHIKWQEKIRVLNDKLPCQPLETSFLETLATLSALHLVKMTALHPLEEELGGEVGAKPFEITLTGSFQDLSGFLESVRAFRMVTFEKISIKREKWESDILELNCIIKMYWLKRGLSNPSSDRHENPYSREEMDSEEVNSEEVNKVLCPLTSRLNLSQDPFQVSLLHSGVEESSFKRDTCLKNPNRKRGALEWFPLESLRFVGTWIQNDKRYAIIQDSQGILHRVEEQAAIGKQCGEVERIEEKLLEVREWIEGENKTWEEKRIALPLS